MKTSLRIGTLYLMISQIIFLIGSYAIHIFLGRSLGPELYGIFGVVIALVSIGNLFLTSGIPQAASKYIAENEENADVIAEKTKKIQLVLSIFIFLLYFSSADLISEILNDETLSSFIRISALILPLRAFYSTYSMFLNGMKHFGKQAKAMIVYSTTKVIGVFLLVFAGLSLYGAFIGHILAPIIAFFFAKRSLSFKKKKNEFETKRILKFAIPVTLFSVTLMLLMSIDLLFLKAILGENSKIGFYSAATTIAKIPYFILQAFGISLLPAISKSTSRRNLELTSRYINDSLRYLLILLIPGVFLISGTSEGLVRLLYSVRFAEASLPLSVLIFGMGFTTIFAILCTIITASGKPKISFTIALISLIIDVILNLILIPKYELLGAALSTSLSSLIGFSLSALYVFMNFKALVKIKTFTKIVISSLAIYLLAFYVVVPEILL
ncbi:MAG: flippase, partial [Candidatus Methanofastidiosia archaeon]